MCVFFGEKREHRKDKTKTNVNICFWSWWEENEGKGNVWHFFEYAFLYCFAFEPNKSHP